jgi:REP element-mobilizing transposase RayT
MARRRPQTAFTFRTHGGRRRGAGRKPRGARAGVPHRRREAFLGRFPVHITLRMRREVYSLRSRRAFTLIRQAFVGANERFGFRLNHYSVQGNHMHLIVEADGKESLARGVKGLEVRVARRLNRLMQRRGGVFADRYHAHILRTPSEVRRALGYVRQNVHKHRRQMGQPIAPEVVDRYASAGAEAAGPPATAPPRTWLLRTANSG